MPGMVPVIVGGWGRPQGGGESTLAQVGLDGYKRHWRNLIARYGAWPTVWIVGGEVSQTDAQTKYKGITTYGILENTGISNPREMWT